MKKNNFFSTSLMLLSFLFSTSLFAQYQVTEAVIVNGGKFEFAPPYTDYVAVTVYETATKTIVDVDTIYTQSAQDVLVVDDTLYVAAGDSIVRYTLNPLKRTAATAFGASSTVKMTLSNQYLLVGNWYGSTSSNLRIFDKNTLAFVDTIPEITQGAKDMIVIGDTLYVQQNLTSSSFSDSAGYLAVVDLSALSHVRNQAFNNNGEDLGRLHLHNAVIYGINASSNTLSSYHPGTGVTSTVPVGTDVQTGVYSPNSLVWHDTLYFKSAEGIATYDLQSQQLIDSAFIDTSVTAFALDTNELVFYLTQTDFASYVRGMRIDYNNQFIDTLPVGFSPELLALVYRMPTGVSSVAANSALQLYPNPTTTVINIDPQTEQPYHVQLFNQMGQLVLERNGLNGKSQLDVAMFNSGTYVVRVLSSDKVLTKQLIVQ